VLLNREAPANIAPTTTGTKYSDSVEMSADARSLYISARLGALPDGSVPDTFDRQRRLEPAALSLRSGRHRRKRLGRRRGE
jgi:hypothetical protein